MPVITGTPQNDSLTGTEDPDLIRGLLGADYLFGAGGDDQLEGAEGNDYLEGGAGSDVLLGGADDDSLSESTGTGDQMYGEAGNDRLYYQGGLLAGNPLLDGGTGDDAIDHYQGANAGTLATLNGGDGNDRIRTFGGSQVKIDAGADADFVQIAHGVTNYEIALGSGSDLLALSSSNQFGAPNPGLSLVVTDFAAGDAGDSLSLGFYLSRQLGSWNLADNPFATGHLRLLQSGGDTLLQIDRDGSAQTFYGFETVLTLKSVAPAALTARNLGGWASNGGATAGQAIDGTATADFLSATSGDDLIRGMNGDDVLFGGTGADRIEGGDGADTLEGEFGDDQLYGGAGNDILNEGNATSDQLFGEAGGDSLFVDRQWFLLPAANILMDGGADDDSLRFLGVTSRDTVTMIGGGGNDHINAYLGQTVIIDAGDGDDYVSVSLATQNALVTLGAGADRVTVTANFVSPMYAVTVLDFQAGNSGDKFDFLPLLPQVLSGWVPGTNPFTTGYMRLAQQGADTLLLYDAAGDNSFYKVLVRMTGLDATGLTAFNLDGYAPGIVARAGTDGADSLAGTAGADELIGFAGDDLLNGLGGADRMLGGAGNDLYFVGDSGDSAVEGFGEGNDTVLASVDHQLAAGSHIETLSTASQAGTSAIGLTGNELGNSIFGNEGNNQLLGLGGNDQLVGYGGNDVLVGGAGIDYLRGGLGNDVYGIGEGDIILEVAGEGDDSLAADIGSYFLNDGASIETLSTANQAGMFAQNLTGNELGQSVAGSEGANVLNGRGGNDLLRGYGGADIFLFDTAPGANNHDVIADMQLGVDKIALQNSIFTGLAEGNLGAEAFVVGTQALDANDRIIWNAATNQLFFDADGNGAGAAVLFAIVNGSPNLQASDFLII